MTTRIIIVALALCASFSVHAQVEEIAQQLAENEYKKFADELPDAFAKGRAEMFGNARALKKQFFLEENATTFADFLGWNKKKYSQKSLSVVFQALSEKSKPGKNNPNPLSVTFDFPDQPAECIVTVQKDGKVPKTERKTKMVSYAVTTQADVTVEVSKEDVATSIANNKVALIWDGRIRLVNGEVDEKNMTPPRLRTIVIGSESKEEQMSARAKDLIKEYYQNLQSSNRAAVLAPEIPNKTEFDSWLHNKTRLVVEGDINVPLPEAKGQTIEVRNVPDVTIYVDPTPYMTEDISQYSKTEAYHQLALTFTVDFQADKITKVVFTDKFVGPELAPKPVVAVEQKPVLVESETVSASVSQSVSQPVLPSGKVYYKVQILLLQSYIPLAELPQKYRVENVTVEKYSDRQITYYKYVISANSLNEAFAIKNQMISRGIEDAWIAVYDGGERVRPYQGHPEDVNNK